MKKACFILFFALSLSGFSKEKEDKKKEKDYYKMFSVEASHVYNGLISKTGANAKFYFWVNKSYNFGPEFYYYFDCSKFHYFVWFKFHCFDFIKFHCFKFHCD